MGDKEGWGGHEGVSVVQALRLMSLRSGSRPPWTMANRFCSVGLEWAAMQRSIHLVVLWVASRNLDISSGGG